MSKRNFILLIIILVVVVIAVLGFLYSRQEVPTDREDTGDTNFISRFNPFAKSTPNPPNTTPLVDTSVEPGLGEEILKVLLKKVSSMPIAGYGVYKKERLKKEFMTAVRYVERATGNVYQTFADKIEEKKFSTTVIPKIYEAYFGNNATSVVIRYLKIGDQIITTFVGNLPKELLGGDIIGDNEIVGFFLPDDISDMSVSPDAKKIFYLFNLGDGAIGTTLNFGDNKKVQVFDSPFTEWLSQWPKSSMITLSTKPSFSIPGYMYAIDTINKNFSKVLGGVNGLTTLTSPNGKLILYADNNLSLYIYDVDSRDFDLLGIKTLPEKCVWSKISDVVYCAVPKSVAGDEYPDTWYQGEVMFEDQFWKIDITNKNGTMIVDPTSVIGGEEVDGIKLALDESENYLFFVNKKDSFLWELGLK